MSVIAPRSASPVVVARPERAEVRSGSAGRDVRERHQPHFMLVLCLACPAECSYCFGPHRGPTMPPATLEATLDFIVRIADETSQRKVKITFHGGEPLQAGHDLWRQALHGLDRRLGRRRYELALQSNLWLLDDEFCRLFAEHKVEIGTSLDGPEEITDHQRGRGYFARTMQGVDKANRYGLNVGCIATFTPYTASRWREVFDFFLDERLNFSIHASVPPLDFEDGQHAISPEQYGRLLCEVLDYYVEHRREIAVASLDQMCQGFGCGDGKVCTFCDCLGMFLAIDPYGDIYPCQRFCGKPADRLARLTDEPTLADLLDTPIARRIADRQEQTRTACAGCNHFDYCKGGCPYNAWAGGNVRRVKDPYCEAYRPVLDRIMQRALEEMGSEENIEAVAARAYDGRGHPLLRKGPLIELVREGRHPSQIARTARRIVAAVELVRGPDIPMVAARLVGMGICRTQESAEASLTALQRDLQPKPGLLNNLYLHVTFGCQLHCTHCYARADATGHSQGQMAVDDVLSLVRQAKEASFRQVVITGGEPLLHPQRERLLEGLRHVRCEVAPLNLVLRTNYALPLCEDDLRQIGAAFDHLVVSVDGSEETHDQRRGVGSHAATVRNLETYSQLISAWGCFGNRKRASEIPVLKSEIPKLRCSPAELSLACVMSAADIQGDPGDAVRKLATRLGIRRTRFRPLLPLGRAADWNEPPVSETLGAHADPMDLIEAGFYPAASCGLGQDLYVEPSGESFLCYAYYGPLAYQGNVISPGLGPILASTAFSHMSGRAVDTNSKCRQCDLRFLCGGACRAWRGAGSQQVLDAPPAECDGLQRRAAALVSQALQYLEIPAQTGGRPCSCG